MTQYVVVTWDDAGQVYTGYIDLWNGTSGITNVTGVGSGKDPDVAAIIRNSGSPVEMALVTYTDAANGQLNYAEVTDPGGTPLYQPLWHWM